jgi:hypothetical protein
MSVAYPHAYFIPYIILITVCLVVFVGCLVGVPSLRSYRRKRNIAIYAIFMIVMGLVAFQAYNSSVGPNYISFSILKTQTPIFTGQQVSYGVTCHCDGVKDANFYMVIKSANATLNAADQQGYIQVNGTCIKVPFSFHGGGDQTKPIYFTADVNVSSIAFYPRVERGEGDYVVAVVLTEIQCIWNPATECFAMADSMGLPVP